MAGVGGMTQQGGGNFKEKGIKKAPLGAWFYSGEVGQEISGANEVSTRLSCTR